ncbi:hypothetical protein CJF30_00011111 [Rutstroemia sp. NJR-2017a BBW]|nr:hypothetical protein CJF30_00011111 [Rutstroemia sp. NJR-2017a BBW]
MNWGIIG